jgi:hypothetical protein
MDSRIIILATVVSLIAGVLLAVLIEYLQVSGLTRYLQDLSETPATPEPMDETGQVVSLG